MNTNGTIGCCGRTLGKEGCSRAVQRGLGKFKVGKCPSAECQAGFFASEEGIDGWVPGMGERDVSDASRLTGA